MLIILGNSDALEPQPGTFTEGEEAAEPTPIEGDQITTIEVPSGRPIDEALTEIKNVWMLHSAGEPQWVDGDDELLVRAVASTFGCPIGAPPLEGEEHAG